MIITITGKTVNMSFKDLVSLEEIRMLAEHGVTLMKARITLRSLKADGTPLKPYSTKPISIPSRGVGTGSPLVRPTGVKKKKKSVFFPGGYLQFRASAGRSTTKDLILSGNLMRRLRVKIIVGNAVYVGWMGSKHELIAQQLDTQENQLLFAWSDEEIDDVADRAVDMIMRGLGEPEP